MNITRSEIRTGILVVTSLAVLVGVILYLGAPGVFVPMKTYWIYAENASGIRQGNEVLLAGRRVGQVVKLYSPVPEAERPNPKLETLIEVRVNESADIYKEVSVNLTQNGLLGEMLIDFTSGVEASGIAPHGHTFISVRPAGLDQAVPMVLEKLDPALRKATETLDALQKTAENLSKLTAESGEAQVALAEFRKFGEHLNELTDDDGPLRLSLQNLQQLTGPEGKLNAALDNVANLTDADSDLAKTLANAEQFTSDLTNNKDIDATLANFRQASEKLDNTVGGLGGQFSDIATNLEQATDTVKRQPWRLIWPTTKKYPEDEAKKKQEEQAQRERRQERDEARRTSRQQKTERRRPEVRRAIPVKKLERRKD
ncbi:MAG: MlaD family protein [Chthoniobacteraceae bacterium]